jgi:hypothetical protein
LEKFGRGPFTTLKAVWLSDVFIDAALAVLIVCWPSRKLLFLWNCTEHFKARVTGSTTGVSFLGWRLKRLKAPGGLFGVGMDEKR